MTINQVIFSDLIEKYVNVCVKHNNVFAHMFRRNDCFIIMCLETHSDRMFVLLAVLLTQTITRIFKTYKSLCISTQSVWDQDI